jgi:hypothetical protein
LLPSRRYVLQHSKLYLYLYRATSSVSLKVVVTLSRLCSSYIPHLLLGGDLAVVLDVDVLVGGQSVDLVFGEGSATSGQLRSL